MDMDMRFPGDVREARARSTRNVGEVERWMSVAAGTGLVLAGLRRRSIVGLAGAAVGALLIQRGATGYCDFYEAAGINTAASSRDTRRVLRGRGGTLVDEAVWINRPASELYAFWRRLENLPRFMPHLESVEQSSETSSRWVARGPRGLRAEWTAEIINDIPGELIAWQSTDGSAIVSAGSVRFDNAGPDRGTRVRVRMQYNLPGGKLATLAARATGNDPASEIREDLRRFKQLIEGEES